MTLAIVGPVRLWLAERHASPGRGVRRPQDPPCWVLLHEAPTTSDHADSVRIFAVDDATGLETLASVVRWFNDPLQAPRFQPIPKPKSLPYYRE